MPRKAQHIVNRQYAGNQMVYKLNALREFLYDGLILRFEKLDITPRSALKIRPVLENWLREAEKKHQQGNLQQIAGLDYINISSIGKIRKRRTFFSPEALVVLNCRFEQSSHPSGHYLKFRLVTCINALTFSFVLMFYRTGNQ